MRKFNGDAACMNVRKMCADCACMPPKVDLHMFSSW